MNIKKRIFLSNTLMMLLALIALFAVGYGFIALLGNSYNDNETRAQMEEISSVQASLDNLSVIPTDWTTLSAQVNLHGFNLYVWQEERLIYGSWDYDMTGKHRMDGMMNGRMDDCSPPHRRLQNHASITIFEDNTIVGRSLVQQGKEYTLLAVRSEEEWNHRHSQRFHFAFLWVGFTTILMLALLSQLFTVRLVKRITRPLDELMACARRIAHGDLSVPIQYTGEAEFETVCTTFNQMQQRLKEEQERILAYEKARTDLVAGISHDLRTPLTSVKGYIKGLADGVANTPEKQAQYLSIAYQKACDMDGLLQRLFFFSKMETGSLPLFLSTADLGQFVQQFAQRANADLKLRDAMICCEIGPGTHTVQLDAGQMERVLMNLVENALHYADVSPLMLTIEVQTKDDQIQLCFADNGVGVPPEKLPHLFEQFYRGDEARQRRKGQGSGLGLYIVRYIIEAHGGAIYAEHDKGLKFTIILPKAQGGDENETNIDCRGRS